MFAKFFSIYFLLGSCIPGTNFVELTKLPDLIDHYQLHVGEAALLDEDYTLFNFINDHFINPDEHTQNGHENDHQNLPLHHVSSTLLICCDFDSFDIEELNIQSETPELRKLRKSFDHMEDFFHPPIKE